MRKASGIKEVLLFFHLELLPTTGAGALCRVVRCHADYDRYYNRGAREPRVSE